MRDEPAFPGDQNDHERLFGLLHPGRVFGENLVD
jgi:hypothetical protein